MEGNDVEEWLEDMFAKVGEMWSDLRQAETVNYVEGRVQTIGTDVKSFCSEFIQEVFSSSPAQTQTTTDPVDDIPLVQITKKVQRFNSTEGVSNEIPSAEMTVKYFEESISVKEETSGSIDEPDVIVSSTCDLEDEKISTSFLERDFENTECIDTTNHFVPGVCKNEECLDTPNSRACGTGHPILKELPITNIPDAASSSKLEDVSAGNSVLSERDYTGSGSSEEVIEHETMLGESCIMVYSNDPCHNKHQLTKPRANAKKLQRKPGLRVAMIKHGDSIPEPKADEKMLPLAPEFELIEQDWEIV